MRPWRCRYGDDDLFAVREGATYEESFEFRTDNDLNPEDVDGNGSGVTLFAPALWGRLSRTSQQIPFTQQYFGLGEEIGDGWRRAICRFVIPDNVRLLRCFDIQAVQGAWEKLKIRRHTLKLLSDTVTLSRSYEIADLGVLTSQADLAGKLRELDAKEKEEQTHFPHVWELERKIEGAKNTEATRAARDAQQQLVEQYRLEEIQLKRDADSGEGRIESVGGSTLDVEAASVNDGASIVHDFESNRKYWMAWWIDHIEGDYFMICNQHTTKYLDVEAASTSSGARIIQQPHSPNSPPTLVVSGVCAEADPVLRQLLSDHKPEFGQVSRFAASRTTGSWAEPVSSRFKDRSK